MEEPDVLVLEILKQESVLAMSAFEEKELAQTVRHYSRLSTSFTEIDKICQEVINILNKATKRGGIHSNYIGSLKKTGQVLWDHLFTRSIKDRLKTTAIKNLIFSVDEELISIPWELLYDGNEFLCLKFNLGRVVRTKDEIKLPQYRSLATTPRMLILSNPTGDLKSAYLEGVYIKNQFDRRRKEIAIDFKSTSIDTLYVKKNLRDYDIVHFAGHCEYDAHSPDSTGWVLNDGKFLTKDILALGESLHFPSLIFSNACHSAKSVTEPVCAADYQEKNYSLASAFLFSGVRHYIGSIWKIEDSVSLVFSREFYTQLIKGNPVGECIRLGRLKLIKECGGDTISWANYLLYGNPNFILFKPKARRLPLKAGRDNSLYKKYIPKIAIVGFVIFLMIYLYMWLPARNPAVYLDFFKSQRLFDKGKNQEVASICSKIIAGDPLFLAAYPLMAGVCERMGDREKALRYYFDYALASERKHDKRQLCRAYIGIAWVYHQRGEYPKAFEFYNKAISLSRQNHDRLNEAVALRKLAVWYMDKDEQNKALELLTKSSEINRENQRLYEHRYNLACDYFDLGLVFTNKDDLATAKDFYNKSRKLFEKMKLKNELSDYYFNLGEICIIEKEYQKAMDYYAQGLKIDQFQGNKPSIASDYSMIGELYVEMDSLDKAESSFKQAILISEEINARPEMASAYYNMGLLYKKMGYKKKAKHYLRLAKNIYRLMDTDDYKKIKQEFRDFDI